MRKWKLSLSLVAIIGILAACGNNSTDSTTKGTDGKSGTTTTKNIPQEISVSVPAEITTLDTTKATDRNTFTVIEQIFEGLYRFNGKNELELALAKEDALISPDGLTYTFKLKEDAKWSNGDSVTANDFVYAWSKIVDPASAAPNAYLFANIKNAKAITAGEKKLDELGVKAISDYELQVNLELPQPSFLSLVAIGWFYPQNQKFVEAQGDNYALDTDKILYNGPFTLTNWKDGATDWNYEKNQLYHDKKNVSLDKVNISVIKETSTGVQLYEAGDLDVTTLVGDYAKENEGNPDLVRKQELALQYLSYNAAGDRPLKNSNLRKAISLAIDRSAITENIVANGSKPLGGLIPTNLAKNPSSGEDFRKENGSFLDYNLTEAKKEWELAKKELGDTVALELVTSDDAMEKKLGEYIQSSLSENLKGLTISIRSVPKNVALEQRRTGKFDLATAGWIAGDIDPTGFFILFETGAAYNYGKYQNEQFQNLITDTKTVNANNPEKRYAAFLKAEKILFEDAAFQPLYQRTTNYLQRPTVKGLESHLLGSDFTFRNVTVTE
ncbi:ABC transporter substrate-binding protein [Carnobacterium gallinarum]|uniref:peptide ABC transporter substrate-binding protein n=1 Tax=Carnobacterium gallinarum TaxID=2749 RepID=UPI0005554D40|nr:peptide ABC transporter substrate-binding protein [Carnobacterium gallinarum]